MSDESEEKPVNRGNAGKGRPKGSHNKTTLMAKEVIAQAAEGLGGVTGLMEWVEKDDLNARIFWGTVYPKLLPLKVNSEIEAGPRLAGAMTWLPTQA